MQLFSRRVQVTGPPSEALTYLVDMRAHVTEVTGREAALWSVGFGAPLGTFLYAMRVEGLAEFQDLAAKVQLDDAYQAKLAAGQVYVGGPAEDNLLQPLFGEVGDDHPPVGSVASITTATIANGAYEAAIGWGVAMAEHAMKVTGQPTLFGMPQFGAFGAVTWIGVSETAADADAGNNALNADAEYLSRLSAAGELFAEGSGLRSLAVRVA